MSKRKSLTTKLQPTQTLTRMDLVDLVHQEVGLSKSDSARIVEDFLDEMIDCLSRGDDLKLSSFGTFLVREKRERVGRNPKTGDEVPIKPRKVVAFKPSGKLKRHMNEVLSHQNAATTASTRSLKEAS